MNVLNLLAGFYAKLHSYSGIPNWFLTPIRRITRCVANKVLPCYLDKFHQRRQFDGGGKIVVSVTSFPARIDNVWQVIACMLNQSLRPYKIYLWLSREQFPTEDTIPVKLRNMQNHIFQIRLVDGDIRSHKKYYYLTKDRTDELVFLIDDDIYYPTSLLEKVWSAHLTHPDSVICNYGYHMRYDECGKIKSYKEWTVCCEESDEDNLFFGSGGGTLLQLSALHSDLGNLGLALKLAPLADDVWLNAMVRLAGIKVHMLEHGSFLPIVKAGDIRLTKVNNGGSQNDVQIAAVNNYYGDVFSKL